MKLKEQIQILCEQLKIDQWGHSPLRTPVTINDYKNWLNNNYHADMLYLETSLPKKENPHLSWPTAKTVLSFGFSYFPHPHPRSDLFPAARIATYAKGDDYHFWIKEKLEKIKSELQQLYPNDFFLSMTDSFPLLEREFARSSGLGWVGKNTCIIHPKKGSLFLLGEILTSLDFEHIFTSSEESKIKTIPDFCGNCTKCLEICPTQALTKEKTLDSNRCISYWTIESRQIPPIELRSQFQDWLFGCDLCQTVCPWNQKAFPIFKSKQQNSYANSDSNPNLNSNSVSNSNSNALFNSTQRQELIQDLAFILSSSGKRIEKIISGTPLKRAGPFGLRRNSLIVIANLKLKELIPQVQLYLKNEKLSELAKWCLEILET